MSEPSFQRDFKKRKRKSVAPEQPAVAPAQDSDKEAQQLGPRYLASPCFDLASDNTPPNEAATIPQAEFPQMDLAEPIVRDPGPGKPLNAALRERLEKRFSRDLSHIRVHSGPDAATAAGSLEAAAFTHGHHIFLSQPQQADDARVMAHELTHTVQQGAAPPLRLAPAQRGNSGVVPRVASPAPATAAAGPASAVQRIDVWGAARRAGQGLVSGVRAVGGAVADVGGDLLSMGRDALLAIVRRVAPDFLPLFEGDGIAGFVRRLITRGLRSMFDGLMAPLRGILDFGAVGERVTQAVSWLGTIAGQLANNDCSGILAAARQVGQFFSAALGPVIDKIKSISNRVKGFFSSIWDAIGAPIMDMLKSIGGDIWESLKGFVRDCGRVLRRARDALGAAWQRVKGWFGIEAEDGEQEGGGLWNWIKEKASAVGSAIARVVRPVMGPLRVVGATLLLLVPGGQLAAIMLMWPRLKQAYNWLSQKWSDLNLIPRARAFLANTVLPAVMNAAEALGQAVLRGADWLLGIVDRVAGALASVAQLSVGVLSPLSRVIGYARQQFGRLINWARGGLRSASRNFRSLMRRLIEFLGVVLDALRQIMAFVINPFGIVGFLAGTLWRLIPDCLKGPIIDFIVNIILRLLRAMPPMPMLGLLWPLVKSSMIGFFERVKSFSRERKVLVSKKVARIVSGMSPSFAWGYVQGLALGVWRGITAPFHAIAAIFNLPEQIQNFLSNLGVRLCEIVDQIRCFAANLAGRVFGTLDDVLSALGELLEDPARVIELIRCAIEGALSAARGIGEQIADQLMSVLESAEEEIGRRLGEITGNLLVQAVITYFTAGVGAGVGIVNRISSMLGAVGRAIGQVVRALTQLFGRLVSFVRGFASKLAGAVARGGRSVLSRLGGFFRRVAAWLGRLVARMAGFVRRRFGLTPAQRAQWLAFRGQVGGLTSRYLTQGVRRRELASQYRRILRQNRFVAKWPAFITKHGPHWRLWVRRVKSIRPRRVGHALLDPRTRVRQAMKAVKRHVRVIKRLPDNISAADIRRGFGRIQSRYRLQSLNVNFNPSTDKYEIVAIANPRKEWTTKPKRPKDNVISVVNPGRHVIADPLVKNRPSKSGARGTTPLWSAVRPIRAAPSGSVSLYVKGHLISGWFASGGPSNWTPITRSANAQMEGAMETPIWARLLPGLRNKPVFKYEVQAVGSAGNANLRDRKIRGLWQTIPSERSLARSISMRLTTYHYNDSSETWNRVGRTQSVPVDNVPPFPMGVDEPRR